MDSIVFRQRLKDLSEHIEKDLELLKEFEDALRYEDDPRRKAKYRIEAMQLKESSLSYQEEYIELKQKLEPKQQGEEAQEIEFKLNQMDGKLNLLLDSQIGVHQKLESLNELQSMLLARYNNLEQSALAPTIQKLNRRQSVLTNNLLDALEAKQFSQQDIQLFLNLISTHSSFLPSEQAELTEIINSPEISAEHKLKVTIPIIPFILDYEGELKLGSSFNMKEILDKIRAKFGKES
jgi:hypothetical protein